MIDREIVIYLAEKVMGWAESDGGSTSFPIFRFCRGGIYPSGWRVFDHRLHCGRDWNPLESIADAFEVQAAVPECKMSVYARELVIVTDAFMNARGSWELHRRDSLLIAATARQRCLAIVEATK